MYCMENRYYQIAEIPIKISSNNPRILRSLDKPYCSFKQNKLETSPLLELIISSNNGNLRDLTSFEIFAITPSSFDGWSFSSKLWCRVDLLGRYVFEIDKAPSGINFDKKTQKLFEIKTRTKPLGVKVGWLSQVHLHINLFVLDYRNNPFIHGGCLEWQNRGLIISGRSGSGKSTLTYALAKSGLRFLTDECILFDTSTNQLLPYPISPSFEEPSKELFREVKESFEEDKRLGNKSNKSFLDIKKLGIKTSPEPVTPSVLIFPKYTPGEPPAIKTISKSEAIGLLAGNIGAFEQLEKIKTVATETAELLATQCDCYELISSGLEETVKLVKEVMAREG